MYWKGPATRGMGFVRTGWTATEKGVHHGGKLRGGELAAARLPVGDGGGSAQTRSTELRGRRKEGKGERKDSG